MLSTLTSSDPTSHSFVWMHGSRKGVGSPPSCHADCIKIRTCHTFDGLELTGCEWPVIGIRYILVAVCLIAPPKAEFFISIPISRVTMNVNSPSILTLQHTGLQCTTCDDFLVKPTPFTSSSTNTAKSALFAGFFSNNRILCHEHPLVAKRDQFPVTYTLTATFIRLHSEDSLSTIFASAKNEALELLGL